MPGIPIGNAPNILAKSYTITAEVEVPQGGGNGMIVTEGGRWGGYGLYLLKGKPVFNYNLLMLAQFRWEGKQALAPGKHTIVFDFTYDGPGIAKGGTGVLKVDGKEVANQKIPHTIAFLLVADETFDVGVDTRTGVNDKDYQVPFRIQRQDRQVDLRSRADAVGGERPESHKRSTRQSERLGEVGAEIRLQLTISSLVKPAGRFLNQAAHGSRKRNLCVLGDG